MKAPPASRSPSPPAMQRPAIGIIALVLLFTGAGLYFGVGGSQALTWAAGCLRIGMVMAVTWLAYPQLSRLPLWFFGLLLACVVAVALKPKLLIAAVVILIAAVILRPRKPAKRERRN